MAANVKPVKVLTDLVTKKQIIKKDGNDVLFNVSGTLLNGGHVSSSLPLTASAAYTPELIISSSATFQVTQIEALVTDKSTGKYNVDAVIHEIDKALKTSGVTDAVRAAEAVNAYKRVRYWATGSFDADGYAEVRLPLSQSQYNYRTFTSFDSSTGTWGSPVYDDPSLPSIDGIAGDSSDPQFLSFPTSSKDYINLDVMVKDCENTEPEWVNDLIAVNLVVSGAANDELWVRMLAPEFAGTAPNVKYRLLAVNEDPQHYIIR